MEDAANFEAEPDHGEKKDPNGIPQRARKGVAELRDRVIAMEHD